MFCGRPTSSGVAQAPLLTKNAQLDAEKAQIEASVHSLFSGADQTPCVAPKARAEPGRRSRPDDPNGLLMVSRNALDEASGLASS
jgi:hypothetical protein